MAEFIGGSTRAREILEPAPGAAEELPDTAWWDGEAAAFRAAEEESVPVSVTVNTDILPEPYGVRQGFFRRLLRRVLRRLLRWYIEPMVQQQNAVNRSLLGRIQEQERRIRELEAARRA